MTMPTLVSSLLVSVACPVAIGWIAPLLAGGAWSSRSRRPAKVRLRGLLQDPGEALLDRLGGLGRDFSGEFPKLLALCRRGFVVLAAVRGRQLDDFRQRFGAHEEGQEIESGGGVCGRDLDDL